MKKRGTANTRAKRDSKSGMVIGRERFAKISAVEGVVLTSSMKKRAADSKRRGLSGEERRREIVRAYREG